MEVCPPGVRVERDRRELSLKELEESHRVRVKVDITKGIRLVL